MHHKHVFKGKIKSTTGPKKILLDFDVSTPTISMEESFMTSFQSFHFSEKEKMDLSFKYRERIKKLLKLDRKALKSETNKLIKNIKSSQCKHFNIEASELGAFICLAAIYSGKLPKSKTYSFNLIGAPIGIFPESLVKNTTISDNIDMRFIYDRSCWVKKFKCLYTVPSFMDLGVNDYDTSANITRAA